MFSFVKNVFGGLEVEETKDTYIVRGIKGHNFAKFMTAYWNTSLIAKEMFKVVTGN